MFNSPIRKFEICNLDHVSGVYVAGDTINGELWLHTAKDFSNSAFFISLVGQVQTWFAAGGETFTSEDIVAMQRHTFLKNAPIKRGLYVLKFSLHIPTTCPSTLLGYSMCKIGYVLEATIEKQPFPDVVKVPITIRGIVDLNRVKSVKGRTIVGKQDSIPNRAFCFLGTSSLLVELKFSKMGFLPGEDFEIPVFVQNRTREAVTELRSELVEYASISGRGISEGSHTEQLTVSANIVAEIKRVKIPPGRSEDVILTLRIPSHISPQITHKLMKTYHILKIFTNQRADSICATEVTIGSIALRERTTL
ncbi:hypothetical protein L596_023399 [Steinernema carpocapsae]|uniref:Arrestin C-terminal-like domain-containing protein n=1 Tax=Steinernema carpocapsae TaxID=34508 RepID=A0A4U5MDK7_STECR|nr:hypothetical protein L596_023399 [Steinernema carpocapsae]